MATQWHGKTRESAHSGHRDGGKMTRSQRHRKSPPEYQASLSAYWSKQSTSIKEVIHNLHAAYVLILNGTKRLSTTGGSFAYFVKFYVQKKWNGNYFMLQERLHTMHLSSLSKLLSDALYKFYVILNCIASYVGFSLSYAKKFVHSIPVELKYNFTHRHPQCRDWSSVESLYHI